MKKCYLFTILLFCMQTGLYAQIMPGEGSPLEGRWDMVLQMEGKTLPSWLGVYHSGFKTLVGQFVGPGGSARPISEVFFENNTMHFSIPPQWEKTNQYLTIEGKLQGDSLVGTGISSEGVPFTWTAHRAPLLHSNKKVVWGEPIRLFNGKDLTGWHAMGPNQWVVENGVLKSPHSGSNLVSDKKFQDFKLHVEFKYPAESNSGVYLRGRYEVQIIDSKGKEPAVGLFSAIYGFIAPSEMVAKSPGEWQSFDITLVGRMVTVIANGVKVICNREIPGITGGALDSKEENPGPIYFQGDHGPIEFRNIIITPAKE